MPNKLTEFVKAKQKQGYKLKAILTMLDITDRQYRLAITQNDSNLKVGLVNKIEELSKWLCIAIQQNNYFGKIHY